jgi:hypothetical protein
MHSAISAIAPARIRPLHHHLISVDHLLSPAIVYHTYTQHIPSTQPYHTHPYHTHPYTLTGIITSGLFEVMMNESHHIPAHQAVELEGFLTKRGEIVQNWKRRWFILSVNGEMHYFRKKSAVESGKPQGTIQLYDVRRVQASKQNPKAFTIKTAVRDFDIIADSEEECQTWVAAIIAQVNQIREQRKIDMEYDQQAKRKTVDKDGTSRPGTRSNRLHHSSVSSRHNSTSSTFSPFAGLGRTRSGSESRAGAVGWGSKSGGWGHASGGRGNLLVAQPSGHSSGSGDWGSRSIPNHGSPPHARALHDALDRHSSAKDVTTYSVRGPGGSEDRPAGLNGYTIPSAVNSFSQSYDGKTSLLREQVEGGRGQCPVGVVASSAGLDRAKYGRDTAIVIDADGAQAATVELGGTKAGQYRRSSLSNNSDAGLVELVESVQQGLNKLGGLQQWMDDHAAVRTDERLGELESKVNGMDAKLDEVLRVLRGTDGGSGGRPGSGSSGE